MFVRRTRKMSFVQNQWLDSLASHPDEAVIVIDDGAQIIGASSAAERLFAGKKPPGLNGSIFDLIGTSNREAVTSLLNHEIDPVQPLLHRDIVVAGSAGSSLCLRVVCSTIMIEGGSFCVLSFSGSPQRVADPSGKTAASVAHPGGEKRFPSDLGVVRLVTESQLLGAHLQAILTKSAIRFEPFDLTGALTDISRGDAHPALVIMAAAAINPAGIDDVRSLKTAAPESRLLFVSFNSDEAGELEILRAGASGIINAEEHFSQITRALFAISDGEIWCPRSIMARVLEQSRVHAKQGRNGTGAASRLTPREREVLDLLCRDMSNKEIAVALDVATTTVVTHLFNIYRKLKIRNRYQAVKFAHSRHFMDPVSASN